MSDVFVNLVDLNEQVDYATFVMLFCSYLLLLWLVISIWVGVDAYRRFNNKLIALGFFLLTMVLNFPILIFYFIVRPDGKYEDYQEWETQGVSVPLVNFKGDKGVEMVLELKMQPANVVETQRDMKIDVSWESARPEMELAVNNDKVQEKQVPGSLETELSPRADRKVTNVFSKLGGRVSKRITRFKEVSAEYVGRRKRRGDNKSEGLSDQENSIGLGKAEDMQQIIDKKDKDKGKKKRKRKLKKNKKR